MKVIKKRGTATKPSKVVAKFAPPIKRIAKNLEALNEMKLQRNALAMRQKGESFEAIASTLGVDPEKAFELVQSGVEKWASQMRLTGKQEREMDLKRYDALLTILWKDIEPQVMKDKNGNPIYDEVTGAPVMRGGDKVAIKLYLEILERRSKLLGTESQTKLVTDDTGEIVRREYVGVDLESL